MIMLLSFICYPITSFPNFCMDIYVLWYLLFSFSSSFSQFPFLYNESKLSKTVDGPMCPIIKLIKISDNEVQQILNLYFLELYSDKVRVHMVSHIHFEFQEFDVKLD